VTPELSISPTDSAAHEECEEAQQAMYLPAGKIDLQGDER
jgi:hypothetical protein